MVSRGHGNLIEKTVWQIIMKTSFWETPDTSTSTRCVGGQGERGEREIWKKVIGSRQMTS